MKILVLYGTTEGQTRKIAAFVADKLREAGDSVTLTDATGVELDFRTGEFDAAILTASIHAGQYQAAIVHFARHHWEHLNQMPSLFISVSLSAADPNPEGVKSVTACADNFIRETGWRAEVKHVAGAFRFTEYDFFKRWVMRVIAWEKGIESEGGQSDLELTDWAQVDGIVRAFHDRAIAQLRAKGA